MLVIFSISMFFITVESISSIQDSRSQFIEKELAMSIGRNIVLDENESKLNNILMKWKHEEVDYAFNNPKYFNFSRSYFEYKDIIKKSKVYLLIKEMPKGAVLHSHSSALLGPDYLMKITYKENLYVCFGNEIKFKFAKQLPDGDCEKWQLMKDLRKSLQNVSKFDNELQTNFTLNTEHAVHTDVNSVWISFNNIFRIVYELISYEEVWKEYLYDALTEFRKDNIMYVEIRSGMPELYDFDGKRSSRLQYLKTSKDVVDKFVKDHPDFIGAKFIYTTYRLSDVSVIRQSLEQAKEFKKLLPDFMAGYDLVGQEDLGKPLKDFLPELHAVKNDLVYFFHAGETNWYGTNSDENLIDAVLLGTKRIGHAYAVLKHPLVLEEIKKNSICLEVNVLSNSVLALVEDVRNHPLATFIAQGLPVVLSSDDPGLWEADPLSTDFYVAFVGIASRSGDLRLLKQLALNSIKYSTLSNEKKKNAFGIFDEKWKKFVMNALASQNEIVSKTSSAYSKPSDAMPSNRDRSFGSG